MLLPSKFGCFLSPLHPISESPQQLIQHDLELVSFTESLGFDEFWVGEHHSGGWGLISSPELFIAAASERSSRIKLATGVVSAPYHHPYMVAERATLLSHLTQGRFILGLGAGSVTGDMHMLGIQPSETRPMTAESVEVISELLNGVEVSRDSDWFTLNSGRVQLRPYGNRPPEIVVASAATPFGMKLAGRLGINALSHGAPPWGVIRPGADLGVAQLAKQWEAHESAAEANGHRAERSTWRVSFPVHVSTSKEKALDEIHDGWVYQRNELWKRTMGLPMSQASIADDKAFEATVQQGGIIAGSVDDCVHQIMELARDSGGFGTLLVTLQDWASRENQKKSLDLFGRFVIPRLTGQTQWQHDSRAWTETMKSQFQTLNSAGRGSNVSKEKSREATHV